MSEHTLHRFLARLNEDVTFREVVQADPSTAFRAHGLSPREQASLIASDEDALRRLSGAEVTGYFFASMFCSLACPATSGSSAGGSGAAGGRGEVEQCTKVNIN